MASCCTPGGCSARRLQRDLRSCKPLARPFMPLAAEAAGGDVLFYGWQVLEDLPQIVWMANAVDGIKLLWRLLGDWAGFWRGR